MGGLDPAKIFLLLVIALVVVGPERLPGAARQLGGMWRELNRMREKFDAEVRAMVPDLDLPKVLAGICREVPPNRFRDDISSTAIRREGSGIGD